MKIYRNENPRETLAKDYHIGMIQKGKVAKLEPNLFLIADTDELQKQVNRMEHHLNMIHKLHSRKMWRNKK